MHSGGCVIIIIVLYYYYYYYYCKLIIIFYYNFICLIYSMPEITVAHVVCERDAISNRAFSSLSHIFCFSLIVFKPAVHIHNQFLMEPTKTWRVKMFSPKCEKLT